MNNFELYLFHLVTNCPNTVPGLFFLSIAIGTMGSKKTTTFGRFLARITKTFCWFYLGVPWYVWNIYPGSHIQCISVPGTVTFRRRTCTKVPYDTLVRGYSFGTGPDGTLSRKFLVHVCHTTKTSTSQKQFQLEFFHPIGMHTHTRKSQPHKNVQVLWKAGM